MSKLSRRKFLQAGSVAAAATVLSGCTVNLQRIEYLESYGEPPEETLPGEDLWYASTCRQCSAGCGILVRVSNGRARKIEGNPEHPVNRGKLCARGQAVLQELYDPDRLRNAVQQTGGRNSLQFEPLMWDNALYELGQAINRADPAAVAFLGGNMTTHLVEIVERFMGGLGAPKPVLYSLADELDGLATLLQASNALFGAAAVPFYDIANAEVLFSFGANLLETWLSPVSQSRSYAQMRRQGLGKRGYFVQFEARMSSTAASADEWIAVRPGTEGLVALALGKMISEATGQHQEWYEEVDPAGMADASGVPLEDLERLASIFSRYERSVAIPGATLAGQQNSLAALTATHALNLLANRLGKAGGVFISTSSVPSPATFVELQELVDRMKGGKVEVLLIHGCNPAFELPLESGFVDALASVPLVVSFGSAVDDTAVHADMILPDHTNLEAWGYQIPPLAQETVISGLQPVMRPLYDTRATTDVLLALSKWVLPGAGKLPWDNEVDFLEEKLGEMGADWATWRREGGWWSDESAWLAPSAGQPVLRLRLPIFKGTASRYRFHLHVYPSTMLGDGRGANKPWLQEAPDPMTTASWQTWIEIHPEIAHELGLENDDVVRVISPAGSVEAIVYLYHGIAPDVVAMPVGRGHAHYGRFAKDFGSNPIRLLVPAVVAETGALAWGATRVALEKINRVQPLPRLESVEGVEYLRGGGEEH